MSNYPEQGNRGEKETREALQCKMLAYANDLLNRTETGLSPELQDRLIEVTKAIEMHYQTEALNHVTEQFETLSRTAEKGFYIYQN